MVLRKRILVDLDYNPTHYYYDKFYKCVVTLELDCFDAQFEIYLATEVFEPKKDKKVAIYDYDVTYYAVLPWEFIGHRFVDLGLNLSNIKLARLLYDIDL